MKAVVDTRYEQGLVLTESPSCNRSIRAPHLAVSVRVYIYGGLKRIQLARRWEHEAQRSVALRS